MKKLRPGKANLILIILIVLLTLALLGVLGYNYMKVDSSAPVDDYTTPEPEAVLTKEVVESVKPAVEEFIEEVIPEEPIYKDAATLMASFKSALMALDEQKLAELFGKEELSQKELLTLKTFLKRHQGKVYTLREVGEIEINQLSRWSLGLEGSEEEIFVNVKKQSDGGWLIKSFQFQGRKDGNLPNNGKEPEDSLVRADKFISAMLSQNFKEALEYAESDKISDARIASLCIMFEEGKYELSSRKPLRSLFQREGLAAYTVNVKTAEQEEKGQFGITLERDSPTEEWKVVEINFDKLLSDYIERVAGGDSYYTPLVENPEGGETLALYFDFNEQGLTLRAQRQLDIIAGILLTDSDKKLTISGHADAIGSDDYNKQLSLERAVSVTEYLGKSGIRKDQVSLLVYGESKPRRNNDTDQGRRVNRRTEIYLDF